MTQINAKRSPRVTVAALCCLALFLYAVYLGALGVLLPAMQGVTMQTTVCGT